MRQRSSRKPNPRRKRPAVASLEAEMLRRVRARGGLSRVDLARELQLVPSTAGIYVDRLIRRGYLLESRKAEKVLGRPPTLLTPNPSGGRFVGVDFEARNLRVTCVDFSQRPAGHLSVGLRQTDTAERILTRIENAIDEIVGGRFDDILGIGVGVPGIIDPQSGIAVEYTFLPGWRNVPLAPRLRERFGVPVYLENNIRSMALAELWFGQGLGLENFICVGTRAGIASGIVANGQLIHGHRNIAGEIGAWACPIPTVPSASKAAATQTEWKWHAEDRLETVASLSAVQARMREAISGGAKTSLAKLNREPEIQNFIEAVLAGDAFAVQLLDSVARVHGWVAHQLCQTFDPQRIIFAGPLTVLGERFLTPARRTATLLADGELRTEIVLTQLGEYNGALGAAALALHQWKPDR